MGNMRNLAFWVVLMLLVLALFNLFSGATMFGAFFIITDPVSSAVSNRGRQSCRRR